MRAVVEEDPKEGRQPRLLVFLMDGSGIGALVVLGPKGRGLSTGDNDRIISELEACFGVKKRLHNGLLFINQTHNTVDVDK